MEALGVTASVIAIATLAAQSAKAAYEVIDGLVEAPQAIANSRTLLLGTQNTLDTLNGILKTDQDNQAKSESVLQLLTLDKTLGSTRELCVKFSDTITKYTRRSTDLRFSNRDRILVNLHESQIDDFNKQLSDCQQTISLIISTIVLYVSSTVISFRY